MRKTPKKTLLKRYDAKLVDLAQKIARYRDGFKCVTCGKQYPYGETSELHGGHYISRQPKSTKYDLRNIAAQCCGCNFRQSKGDVEVIHNFEKFIDGKHGAGTVENLIALKHQTFKPDIIFYETQIPIYENKLNQLKEEA